MSALGHYRVRWGCPIKQIIPWANNLRSKRRRKTRKPPAFCSGNSKSHFVNSGGVFREKILFVCKSGFGVINSPTKSAFYSKRRFCGLSSTEWKLTVTRYKTKKAEAPFKDSFLWDLGSSTRASAFVYFQSLKISSRALSNAAFRLFCMILNISASRVDFFFFFLSFFRDLSTVISF